MNEVSLYTGTGAFTLGLRLAGFNIRTVCYVENEPYCQDVIKARIYDGHLDDAPIWDDIRTFRGEEFRGLVDIVTAGFPCQPHSTAGKRRGSIDERNLWPDTLRAISEVGPRIVLLENVPGILSNGYGGTVVGQLSQLGYDCQWGVVSAAAVGAPHLRKRWWCLGWNTGSSRCEEPQARSWVEEGQDTESLGDGLLADAEGRESGRVQQRGFLANPGAGGEVAHSRQQSEQPGGQRVRPESSAGRGDVADSPTKGLEGSTGSELSSSKHQGLAPVCRWGSEDWWQVEPGMGRVADGTPHRVDRLKALGNGIVPAVVAEFLRRIA